MSCVPDTRKLSDILPYILPNCIALPEEMAMDYGRRAYIEFARFSGALVKLVVEDLQEGVFDYPLVLPEYYKVNRVNWVQIQNFQRVVPTYEDDAPPLPASNDITRNYSGGSMNGSYGYGPNHWRACGPWLFSMRGYNCVILHKAPVQDHCEALRVSISVIPTQDTCFFEDDFFDRWVEGIAYGALAKAYRLPNTDWFNEGTAKNYERKFMTEVTRAKQKFNLNYSRGPLRMQARRFV